MTDQERVEQNFGRLFALVPGPMPDGPMRRVIDHESGGRQYIVVADQVTGASELGACQLVVEHDANANPNMRSKGGAIGANVDPLTFLGALYGAQYVYNRAKGQFVEDMQKRKVIVPPDGDVRAWISILHFKHSIGRTGFKMILDRGVARGFDHPICIMRHFATREMPPRVNRQSPEKVRLRLVNLLELPDVGAALVPLPATMSPLPPRPDGLAPFDKAKAKRYILAERARVRDGRLRKADGSPLP